MTLGMFDVKLCVKCKNTWTADILCDLCIFRALTDGCNAGLCFSYEERLENGDCEE